MARSASRSRSLTNFRQSADSRDRSWHPTDGRCFGSFNECRLSGRCVATFDQGAFPARSYIGREKRMFSGAQNGVLATVSAKVRIAFALGLLSDETYADLLLINDIRNTFAHSLHKGVNFDNEYVVADCGQLMESSSRRVSILLLGRYSLNLCSTSMLPLRQSMTPGMRSRLPIRSCFPRPKSSNVALSECVQALDQD